MEKSTGKKPALLKTDSPDDRTAVQYEDKEKPTLISKDNPDDVKRPM